MHKEGDGMSRDSLKPLKNKTVTVTGRIENITLHPKVKIPNRPINANILLKEVTIGGHDFDHVWVNAPKKYFHNQEPLLQQIVKFKAKVTPYVKHGQYGYVEDYGIDYVKGLNIQSKDATHDYDEKYLDEVLTVDFFLMN